MFYVSICVIKISFSLGARMLFLLRTDAKVVIFAIFKHKKEKSEKKFGVFKNICTFAAANKKSG